MRLSISTLSLLPLLPFLTLASPAPIAGADAAPAPAPALEDRAVKYFFLKTDLIEETYDKKKYDDLYVSGYHTGAGLNDAVLGAESIASKAYLNDTSLQFAFGTAFPWGFQPVYEAYAAWEPAAINAGATETGFSIDKKTGLVWGGTEGTGAGFGGWLVCDWFHGVPQLFFRNKYYAIAQYPTPTSCADVYLLPVYTD